MGRLRVVLAFVTATSAVTAVAWAAPQNDGFAAARVVSSLPFTDIHETAGATTEPDEPRPCGQIGATVWYRYTATEDAAVMGRTFGSDYDTVLAVYAYRGSLIDLVELACDDDSDDTVQSEVLFGAERGVTYYFQAGGFRGATGRLDLHVFTSRCIGPPDDGPVSGFVHDEVEPSTGLLQQHVHEANCFVGRQGL